jgi:hypothetical protein
MNINSVTYGNYRVSDDAGVVVLANTKSGRAWTLTEEEKAYLNGHDTYSKEELAAEIEGDRLFEESDGWGRTPY